MKKRIWAIVILIGISVIGFDLAHAAIKAAPTAKPAGNGGYVMRAKKEALMPIQESKPLKEMNFVGRAAEDVQGQKDVKIETKPAEPLKGPEPKKPGSVVPSPLKTPLKNENPSQS
ncbi:MAG: hypothetical protein NTV07_03880 [Candidatus Omnitrophica bacterium]|nr:hypothetical protein [Candidatus Omnitrophota bacterium]